MKESLNKICSLWHLLLGAISRLDVAHEPFAANQLRFPARGVLGSAVAHAAILSFCLYPPQFRSLVVPRIVELRSYLTPEYSIVITKRPLSARPASLYPRTARHSAKKSSNAISFHGKAVILTPSAPRKKPPAAHPTHSGPQEIVSLFPNSTNSVQTILRPDLVNPPVLKLPQLLKPLVILPLTVPAPSGVKPANPVGAPASTQRINNSVAKLPVTNVAGSASLSTLETQAQSLPEIESAIPAVDAPAVIVLDAVTVPENAPLLVPKAELSGSFAVGAVHSVRSGAGAGTAEGSTASADATITTSQVAERGSHTDLDPASATSTGNIAGGPNASDKISAGDGPSDAIPNHTGQVKKSAQGGDTGIHSQAVPGVPGITIIGGTSRAISRVGVSARTAASSFLTVISSGASGGASRDLGVFERGETVYTVYIPMEDAGGGPDWSMQYAILGSFQAGRGLLTPPVPVKKVRAVVTGDSPDVARATIFFSAVISPKGKLTVKLPSQMDAPTRQALDALYRWEFLPAQLNGIAVEIKVLIGVATNSH